MCGPGKLVLVGTPRSLSALLGAVFGIVIGCGASSPVHFRGQSADPAVHSTSVREGASLERNARQLGVLTVECEPIARFESFDRLSLVDVDCTPTRLRRMLREAAAAEGGDHLAAVECRERPSPRCEALLGRSEGLNEAPPAPRASNDVRGLLGAHVSVSFSAVGQAALGSPKAEQAVRDVAWLPPSHRVIGTLSAACGQCEEIPTRDAVRIAAARTGASDVVGVHCVPWHKGFRCQGLATVAAVESAETVY